MQEQSILKNKRQIGLHYEKKAADSLIKKGYTIVCTNFRCKLGEIDIIAQLNHCLIFVEVKYKASSLYGYPREAVNYKKQQRIKLIASWYLKQHSQYEMSCRFDVIEVLGEQLTHIEAAF